MLMILWKILILTQWTVTTSTDSHAAKNGSSSPVSTPTKGRRGGRGSNSSQRNGTSSPEPAAAPSTPTRASTRLRQIHTIINFSQVFMFVMIVFIGGMSYCNNWKGIIGLASLSNLQCLSNALHRYQSLF